MWQNINHQKEKYRSINNELTAEMLYYQHFDQDTIYEYYVDTKNKTWSSFDDKLPKGWRYNSK